MQEIKQLYSAVTGSSTLGVEGYYVQNKYFDARRSREQKILATSKNKSVSLRQVPHSNKTTFIDEIKKRQAKLPGPSSYQLKQHQTKEKSNLKSQSPPRITYFQEIQKIQKKFNFPAPGKYDQIEAILDKKKQKSGLGKAEVCSYLQNSMRNSIQLPGVGSYNAHIELFDHRGNKWSKQKPSKSIKSMSERGIKAPEVGTYQPHPVSYDLFQSIGGQQKKKQKTYFSREQRFKDPKGKAVPFYNVLSEWGMKDNIHKKDILSRVGSSLTHHSVYY